MKKEMDLITIILPRGEGKEVLELAKQKGVVGGFVGVGQGTANKKLMEEYGTKDLTRDVVSVVAPTDLAKIILELASEKFGIGQPNHGIAFSTNVSDVQNENQDSDEDAKVKVITAIIQQGSAQSAMDAARAAGARGGTIVKHDSKGVEEELKIEDHNSEDVILIISKPETYKQIMGAIREVTENNERKSVVYVQDAHFVYGLK